MLMTLKKLVENVPEPIGRFLTVIPFLASCPEYSKSKLEIQSTST